MNLEEFVTDSLSQIIRAIKRTQEQCAEDGAWVSPAGLDLPKPDQTIEVEPGIQAYVHDVQFDVAVSVGDKQGAEAGGGLQVFAVKLKAGGSVEYENSAVSRVQFSVPVVWPVSVRKQRELEREAAKKRENEKVYEGIRRAGQGLA